MQLHKPSAGSYTKDAHMWCVMGQSGAVACTTRNEALPLRVVWQVGNAAAWSAKCEYFAITASQCQLCKPRGGDFAFELILFVKLLTVLCNVVLVLCSAPPPALPLAGEWLLYCALCVSRFCSSLC